MAPSPLPAFVVRCAAMLASPAATAHNLPDEGGGRPGLLRALRADGSIDPSFRDVLDVGTALYRHMVTLRLLSARMVELQRAERVAFHAACLGEEGVIAAAAMSARPEDWVFPGTREWGTAIVRGLPLSVYLHHAFGSSADPAKGHSPPDHPPARKYRVLPASGVAGAHIPQAVGAAWAAKIQKQDVASIAIFGDAASASGDLHNALNFAGVFKPACVFVCRQDGRTQALSLARATAYGIASVRVDGADAIAVLGVLRAALARAVGGGGATLVEAVTVPLVPTSLAHADVLALGDSDPLVLLRHALEREALLDVAAAEAMAEEVRTAINVAVSDAEGAAAPAHSTIFEDVYAEVPAHLGAQKAQKESPPWRR